MVVKKKRAKNRRRTATGHTPLLLGTIALGALEIAARARISSSRGHLTEQAWRNAFADVLERVASVDGEAGDALAEVAQTIREGGRADRGEES